MSCELEWQTKVGTMRRMMSFFKKFYHGLADDRFQLSRWVNMV